MNFLENITFRRNRTTDRQSQSDDDDIPQTQNIDTESSLPEISDDDSDGVQKLRERIESLQTELKNAHDEIEALSLQNREYKRCNDDLQKTNELLLTMKVPKGPANGNITPKKRRNRNKISNTESSSKSNRMTDITPKPKNKNLAKKVELEQATQTKSKQKKICILSTNKHNKVLSIAEDSLDNYSTLCHYLKPNSVFKGLLTGIDSKVADFTMNDFCIVLIGEEDFRTPDNYFIKIADIRCTLQKLTHTNVIICLPTYKYGNFMDAFNWRVETFNNLMYLDTLTHEHAHIFDSNKKLDYDYTMFNRNTCRINDHGMRVILENLKYLINSIQQYNNTKNLQEQLHDVNINLDASGQDSSASIQSQFFRD